MSDSYLVFSQRSAHYLVASEAVRETVWLPELAVLDEMPAPVAGAFNLRGQVVPVIDLDRCFSRSPSPYGARSCVVVIEYGATRIGVLAHELQDVVTLPPSAIEPTDAYRDSLGAPVRFVRAVAKFGADLAMLLDVDELLACAPDNEALARFTAAGEEPAEPETDQALLRRRAQNLARTPADDRSDNLASYAVVDIGGERFGLSLDVVREFAHVHDTVPVPCAPAWVAGAVNLRGEILTLVDLRDILGAGGTGDAMELVVCHAGALVFGLTANAVLDVVHLPPAAIGAPPAATGATGEQWSIGVARIDDHAVNLLDLHRTLLAGGIATLPQT